MVDFVAKLLIIYVDDITAHLAHVLYNLSCPFHGEILTINKAGFQRFLVNLSLRRLEQSKKVGRVLPFTVTGMRLGR